MENNSCARKYSGIGGQAVMEGVMMRNKEKYAVAVRKSDGEIEVMQDVYKGIIPVEGIYKIPFLRGVFSFVDSLVLGLKTLNYSADFYTEDEDGAKQKAKENKDDKAEKKGKGAGETALMTVVMIVSMLIAISLFMVLPYYASLLFGKYIKNIHLLTLVEGIIRLAVFVIYVKVISGMEDIRRVFMYHGAEHKCINCIESGKELNVENVKAASKEHRRCGTSFLLYVMVVSIIFFSLISTPSRVLRVVLRIVLIPVIASVAYELIRLAGKSDNAIVRALSAPGLLMQRLTTREPDEKMIEVGIKSVEAVFDWRAYLKENFSTGE
ncbi:MAG: DUF1385 domain-containing protein [Lachnospiraceae bacterium]|nr:DUF1385 domain-containing protein [Lachnospiraceae bacterium]